MVVVYFVLRRYGFVLLRGSYALFSSGTSHETTQNAYEVTQISSTVFP